MTGDIDLIRAADSSRERRFDGDTARRILGSAAALQQRLDNERTGGYSLTELEQMAAEAGISRRILLSVIERPGGQAGRRIAPKPVRTPWYRSPGLKRAAIALSVAGLLIPLMFAFPALAYTVLWTSLFLIALILAGASPA